jgi:hypothetical protein
MMITIGLLLVLPSLAYFVARAVYVTLGTSFAPGSVGIAAIVGLALIGVGFATLRVR